MLIELWQVLEEMQVYIGWFRGILNFNPEKRKDKNNELSMPGDQYFKINSMFEFYFLCY